MRGSFILNVILAILQTYGATSSLSYSLFATMADSIFDPFSNITLWLSHRAAKKIDESKYPAVPALPGSPFSVDSLLFLVFSDLFLVFSRVRRVSLIREGKARMATVGNIVFSFIMMSVSLILIVESIRDIASHGGNEGDGLTDFHVPAIVAVSIAFFVKLGLFLYCWGLRQYSQVYFPTLTCLITP